MKRALLLVAVLAACKDKPPTPAAGSGSASAVAVPPVPANTADASVPAVDLPPPPTKPASVTPQMDQVATDLVRGYEKLGSELEKVGKDCQKAADLLTAVGVAMKPVVDEGLKLKEQIQVDAEAKKYFEATYGVRLRPIMLGLRAMSRNCMTHPPFAAALKASRLGPIKTSDAVVKP